MSLVDSNGTPLASKPVDPKDEYAALSDEEKARLAEMAEKEDPADLADPVEWAVLLVKTNDGEFLLSPPEEAVKFRSQRTPEEGDFLGAFEVIKTNIAAQITAGMVAAGMAQQAAMMQRAMADKQMQARLGLG